MEKLAQARKPQGIILLVDVAVFTIVDDRLCVLLHERDKEPFLGHLALPGGYVRPEEDASTLEAARRVLHTKIGVEAPYLEQLATYSGPDRDPGGWSASVAYFALVPHDLIDSTGMRGRWTPVKKLSRLAFDHSQIVADAAERIRNKSAYSSLPAFLAGDRFTLPHLQAVYETILGKPIETVTFRRRIDEIDAVEPIKGAFQTGQKNRPAQLYRLKPALRDNLAVMMRGFAGR